MKILLKDGLIADGTGNPAYTADIIIHNERIIYIGKTVPAGPFDQVIDAKGLVVAPGFIDTHSHSDLAVLIQPYIEPKIRQGVTTEILGQDGLSLAPLPQQFITPWRKNLAGIDGDSNEIDWQHETTAGYLQQMQQKGVGLNESYLVPHGNIRMEAMGLDNRKPTTMELAKMRDITLRELKAGAFGLSTGLIYMPCAYAQTEELIELCKVVAEEDSVFVVHQRSEADTMIESMQEILRIGRESGVKIHFSHFKVCGRQNWPLLDQALLLLDEAKREGIRVSFDQYPYVAGSTMLGVILPPWAHDGGTEKLLSRLKSPKLREKMIEDMKCGIPGWDNFMAFAGPDQIFVTSVQTSANQNLVGKNLTEIGKIRGKDVYQAVFDLLYEEQNAVGMVDFYGTEEHVVRLLSRPEQNVCTDGLLGGKPHPRVFGSFPRVLGKYVREAKALSLETAVHKMTGKPAKVFGIKQRGFIRPNYFADLVLFDPQTIADQGTFIEPEQYPIGIHYVLINGQVVVKQGCYHKVLAGKVLRKPSPSTK